MLGTDPHSKAIAEKLNSELANIAREMLLKSANALLAPRKELQSNLSNFDPWNHILNLSSEAYITASGGNGRTNILDSKFHVRADNGTDYLLSSVIYSIAIYIGKKKADKKLADDLAKSNEKNKAKSEADAKKSAADAVMANADAAKDQETLQSQLKKMLNKAMSDLRKDLTAQTCR